MRDDQAAVSVAGLNHTIRDRPVLASLDLTTQTGTVHAVLGASGVGKSTLLRLIGGLERPSSGTIRVLGKQVESLRRTALRRYLRNSVGFVFQDAGLVERWTVRQNIAAARAAFSSTPVCRPLSIEAAVDRVELPIRLLDRRATELSGGERQRVSIARVLVRQPPLVLLDEPTSALDAHRTRTIAELVRDIADEGAVVLVASHDTALTDISDEQTLLRDAATGSWCHG